MTTPHLLLVEDEPEAGALLRDYLVLKGFRVIWAQTGAEAKRLLDTPELPLNAAILDFLVPPPNGPALLQHIRRSALRSHLPVLFLTARDQEADELRTLADGADDYIAKPASLARVLARVEALLRRQSPPETHYPVAHDTDNLRILAEGRPLDLTAAEYFLLARLLDQPNRVFSRTELLQTASPDPEETLERTVDAHIKNIRAKLGPLGRYVRTFRGRGYGMGPGDEE